MPGLTVHFEVLNQLNSPALYADTLANRPAAQLVGRIFFRTDSPFGIYRDTGTAWDLIASPDTTGITGTLATGQVPYATGASTVAGTNNLFWDSTNNRLGIGTATPGVTLDVHGSGGMLHLNGTGTNNAFQLFQNAGTSKWRIGNNYSAGTNYFSIYDNTNAVETLKITPGATNAILFTGNLTATTLIKLGGTSSQFLKADGSIDSNTYITTSTNIYNTDGTLTSNRTLTNGGFNFSILGSTYTNRFTSAGRLLLGTTTESTFLLDVNGGIALRGNDATTTYFPGATPKTIIRSYRNNSTTVEAFTLSITGDEPVFNTGNAAYIFNVSTVENFRIGTTNNIASTPLLFKTAVPSGTTINFPSRILTNALAERFLFGLDSSEAAVIGLGNTSLRIRQITSGNDFFNINSSTGNVVIEKNASALTTIASAKLAVNSTTEGFLLPRMTTTQKNAISSPAQGLMVFDTTLVKLCVYSGTTWETITSV